ncbi:MAG: hypothetical protein SFX73_12855 [Kofleriaceae bacterium]|nr:hypothetical protein [Kofleriaceae bacterium]
MSRFLGLLILGAVLTSCANADGGDKGKRATPVREVTAGAAQIRGGKIRMDVQLGRVQVTQPGKAGSTVVAPHAVVTP